MDKSQEHIETEATIHRLSILARLLESDPEIIDSLPDEEVSAELVEMGVDLQLPLDLSLLAETSSAPEVERAAQVVEHQLRSLFEAARDEIFEDGMESTFSAGLTTLLEETGSRAITALAALIEAIHVNDEIAAESLRWAGRVNHIQSYEERLRLLERTLQSGSARLRDAAAAGLASMDDPHAITYLERAIQAESYTELRADMEQVLFQLESTRRCRSS